MSVCLSLNQSHCFLLVQVYAKETLSAEQWPSDMSEINVNLADVNDNSPIFWPGDVQEVDFSPQHSPGDAVAWVSLHQKCFVLAVSWHLSTRNIS